MPNANQVAEELTAEEEAAIDEEVAREPHEQDPEASIPAVPAFNGAQFVGYVNEVRFDRRGNVILSITVPYRYRKRAMDLPEAYNIPLSFDVQRWKYYDAMMAMGDSDGDGTAT